MRPRPKILTKGVVAEPSHGTSQFVAPHHLPHMIRLHRRDRVRDWRQSEIDVAALGRAKQLLFARDTARATEPARPRSPTWPTELPATIGASRLLRAARGVHTPPWRVQPRSGTPTPCYSHGNTPSHSQYGVPHGPGTLFDKARPPGPDRREHPLYAVLCSRHVGEIPPRQNTPTSTNSPLHAAERRGLRSTPQGRGIQAASLGNDR